jgi:hypothetical protein
MAPDVMEIEVPAELLDLRLPEGLQRRLQALLDRQDEGAKLTATERHEAEGLVSMAEWLSLLRLRARRVSASGPL